MEDLGFDMDNLDMLQAFAWQSRQEKSQYPLNPKTTKTRLAVYTTGRVC